LFSTSLLISRTAITTWRALRPAFYANLIAFSFFAIWHLVRVPFLLDADREKALADEEKRAGGLQKKLDEARTKYEVGRPRFALEVLDVDLHADTRTDYFFWITNCGERSARYVTFDPIGSKSAFHAIRFDAQPTLAPQKRVPLTFRCGGDDNWIMDGNVGRLLLFFEDNPNKESTLSYDIVVKSFDGDVHPSAVTQIRPMMVT
jgi:hypothetical protein